LSDSSFSPAIGVEVIAFSERLQGERRDWLLRGTEQFWDEVCSGAGTCPSPEGQQCRGGAGRAGKAVLLAGNGLP